MSKFLSVALVLFATLNFSLLNSVVAQDGSSAEQQAASELKLEPTVVVQPSLDEKELTEKVSYYMGFNLISNLKRQGEDMDMDQLMKGMSAAVNGPDHESFIAGYQMMKSMQTQGAELQLEKLFAGMKSASAGDELNMNPEEISSFMTAFSELVQKKQMEKKQLEADTNLAAGEAYMAKAAAENPNLKRMENGVQYEVIKEGTGPSPVVGQRIKVDYHGTFLDGKVFDSTTKPLDGSPPEPAIFLVEQVVPGFSKTLQEMKVGSTWKVCIPGPQAYGLAGRGQIGPNVALLFEITLLEIVEE